jgi:hypothetical protein
LSSGSRSSMTIRSVCWRLVALATEVNLVVTTMLLPLLVLGKHTQIFSQADTDQRSSIKRKYPLEQDGQIKSVPYYHFLSCNYFVD